VKYYQPEEASNHKDSLGQIYYVVKQDLEKFQLEAVRIVTGMPLLASRGSICSETGWELIFDRQRVRRLSLFLFQSRVVEGVPVSGSRGEEELFGDF
jgi:glycine cleavage system aminomethyltransferase T